MQSTRFFIVSLIILLSNTVSAQEKGIVGDWIFHPNYTLERNAKNYPGFKIDKPKSRFQRFKTLGEPLLFYEQYPTERICDFIDAGKIPQNQFTVELWVLNHVNLPVGALISAKGKKAEEEASWILGYFDNEIIFHINTLSPTSKITLNTKIEKGWKNYWGHLVGVYDGKSTKLFFNGKPVTESTEVSGALKYAETTQIEAAGYFENEPAMEISNLMKAARLYDYALDAKQIQTRFENLQKMVEDGKIFPETFHFTAGPYLHYATQNTINIVWETDRPAKANIEYGTKLPLSEKVEINDFKPIQEITLQNLEAETPYYYQIKSIGADGKSMESGILSFQTAVKDSSSAFSFCVIGDTESRPHINHQLSKMIWDERPNFLLHLGDITDGGFKEHKFEWTHEYFTGMTPLISRIPVFPVAGNGEADLYWYKLYHRLPEPEAYYSFTFGNSEFFMLNSNADAELKKGGKQYEWLKEKLNLSKAQWKFVVHHHCPFSSDENDFGNTWKGEKSTQGDPKFDDLKKLYEELQVDVVFYGHVHAYERTFPIKDSKIDKENGVIYIKSGGAGGHLEDFSPTHSWFSGKTQRGNHYCRVDIAGNDFYFKMYDLNGRMKDYLEIKK